jgi:hypothetical protein
MPLMPTNPPLFRFAASYDCVKKKKKKKKIRRRIEKIIHIFFILNAKAEGKYRKSICSLHCLQNMIAHTTSKHTA